MAEYRVTAHVGKGFRTDISVAHHSLLADEPVGAGGTDQGPNPYDLLVAALGACIAMTLRMYADRKQWPLEAVTVNLRHSRSHAEDDRKCEDATVRLDEIAMQIELEGELTDEQRARLREIAAMCPVHRTLDAGVRIVQR